MKHHNRISPPSNRLISSLAKTRFFRVYPPHISRLLRKYYCGPEHPAKLRLWRWLWKATRGAKLIVPYANGGWMLVDPIDFVQEHVLRWGTYEPEVWEAIASRLKEEEVFWDIGAHIGVFSILASQDGRIGQIHAFEPDSRQREVLAVNVALNAARTVIHPIALGERSGEILLYLGPPGNTGLSSLVPNERSVSSGPVPCTTIDSLVFAQALAPPTVLKIDVEGSELNVLKGATRLLMDAPPRVIVFEAEDSGGGALVDAALEDYLADRGYRIKHIPRPFAKIEPRENYIAYRR